MRLSPVVRMLAVVAALGLGAPASATTAKDIYCSVAVDGNFACATCYDSGSGCVGYACTDGVNTVSSGACP